MRQCCGSCPRHLKGGLGAIRGSCGHHFGSMWGSCLRQTEAIPGFWRVLGGPGGSWGILERSWGFLGVSWSLLRGPGTLPGGDGEPPGPLRPPPGRSGNPQTGEHIDIWRVSGGVWALGGALRRGNQSRIQGHPGAQIGQFRTPWTGPLGPGTKDSPQPDAPLTGRPANPFSAHNMNPARPQFGGFPLTR